MLIIPDNIYQIFMRRPFGGGNSLDAPVYDDAANVIETQEHAGRLREP
jgi:hypothetical protein